MIAYLINAVSAVNCMFIAAHSECWWPFVALGTLNSLFGSAVLLLSLTIRKPQ